MRKRPRVCVLTGDPRLPDLTKRDQRYNDEDFATHRAMRAAFEQLQGFRFEFADDHGALFDRFRQDPPDLVINFCDTGFRNVATQELHVPALLELLGVPYSGASAACMAICYDKQIVRLLAQAQGIPVPGEAYLGRGSAARRAAGALSGADQAEPGRRQRRHPAGRGRPLARRSLGLYRLGAQRSCPGARC